VTAAVEHQRLPQVRHEQLQVVDDVLHAGKGDYDVLVARAVQRRRLHDRALPRPGQGPVAVDVAVPVEAAGEAGAAELPDVEGDVVLGQPVGQLRRHVGLAQEAASRGDDRVGPAVQHHPQRRVDVGLELLLRDTRLLEVDLVEAVAGLRPDRLQRGSRAARGVRHRQPDHAADQVGPHQGGLPGDGCAPVVTDDHGRALAQRVDQADDVTDEVVNRVVVDAFRLVGLPVAPLVGRHHVVAGVGEGGDLVAPGVPRLRPAVQQQHERSFAAFGNVHPDAVGLDEPVRYVDHQVLPCRCGPGTISPRAATLALW
jgi:hypothetical protein